ncbi:Exo-beta-1,3-glucanase, GH17 family [Pseudomonas flavescens]|uniref:Beta-monoglucosyldiacylglycerol synthase n=1 Tax=Phytopseudomonas flavescens TaxID=29435 RepID=A0A1G8CX83_9GAMM|nr:glycosyltransferase [Pseudomonas flavescens]SDH50065.1 Exo-beta-1,3-glucanase, GH17 family [Pseudomonas flavescens]
MLSRKFGLNLIVFLAIAALFTGIWALYNRPVTAPDWPEQISGYSFSPFRQGQSPQTGVYPSDEEMRSDLELLAKQTDSIRTYSVDGALDKIPLLAEEFGLRVTLGVWIGTDEERNEREVAKAIEIANTSRSVVRVVVGNEALFRREVTTKQLIGYMDRVRAAVKVPVTTSEQWHIWEKYPELADHADLVAAHVLPYWEFIPMKDSTQFTLDRARDLKKLFPKKPLLLSEVGWPSNGRVRGGAEATQADQAIYLRTLVTTLNAQGYNYFVIEAFDQPWKAGDEGSVGAYWGVYNLDRNAKFNFEGPVVAIPQWRLLAVASVVMALLSLALMLIDGSALHQRGRTFLTFVAFAGGSALVWIGYDYSQQYSTWFSMLVGLLLGVGAIGVFIVLLTEAHELAETVWTQRRRSFTPVLGDSDYRPKVSIHVPCYNEPPEMVKQTLDALANLDYPDFEVLIIDNNTKDPAVWEPVRDYCAELGPRFRFFHVAPLHGFKGGALNYILPHTAADAEVVAVIDSDYCVDRNWLKHMVPHFADPSIAVVQSPQDYRDGEESTFKKLCYAEYKGFFHIGMVTRNDRNAIIQHGTMTMIRRTVMDELKWADWTICEDAELGLRVFEKGYSAAYAHDSFGKGLMPDTFIDYKKQRFRWAYGAIQIMKGHARELLAGKGSELKRGQRYHFIAGWLPWVADGLNIFFTAGALLWSAAMIIVPQRVDPPLLIFAIPPLALFLFKVGKIIFLYQRAVGVNLKDAACAAVAGLALSHTIAKAVLYGAFTKSIPFFRTPKMRSSHGLMVALAEAREEVFIMLLLWGAALGIAIVQGLPSYDVKFWVIMLLVQSLPYLAALIMALLSSQPKPLEIPVVQAEAENA